jgi:hypothetical protein
MISPRNFIYENSRQRTQLFAGYSYDLFRHTIWSLRHFEVSSSSGQIIDRLGIQVFDQVFRPQDE